MNAAQPVDLDPVVPTDCPPGALSAMRYVFQVKTARRTRLLHLRELERDTQARKETLAAELAQIGGRWRERLPDVSEVDSLIAGLRRSEHAAETERKSLLQLAQEEKQTQLAAQKAQAALDESLSTLRAEAEALQGRLHELKTRQSLLKQENEEQNQAIRRLERQRDDSRAQANHARDVGRREVFQQAAQKRAVEVGDWRTRRSQTNQALVDLTEPLKLQERLINENRNTQRSVQKKIVQARQEMKVKLSDIDQRRTHHQHALETVRQDAQTQLAAMGELVRSHRERLAVDGNELAPADTLCATIAQATMALERLRREREAYDKRAFRKGVALWALVVLVLPAAATAVALGLHPG